MEENILVRDETERIRKLIEEQSNSFASIYDAIEETFIEHYELDNDLE